MPRTPYTIEARKEVQLTPLLKALISKDEVRLIRHDCLLGAITFPTSKINELTKAKREVEQ